MVGRAAPAPANIAQKLSDLLMQFPSAAIEGVDWVVLVRKFEERYCTKFDIAALGYDSPLAAASALLWDVARLRDAKDGRNPVVLLEDDAALTPRPGAMGSWPSLYQSLCSIVSSSSTDDQPRCLLLSQLKPLLQRHWHSSIDEHWGYLSSQGASVKTKKMKHLIQAVLGFRNQRVSMSNKAKPGHIDEALVDELELVPSKNHNDLLLRLVVHAPKPVQHQAGDACHDDMSQARWADMEDAEWEATAPCLESHCPYDDPHEPPPQSTFWDSMPTTACSTPGQYWPYSGSSTPTTCSTPIHFMPCSGASVPAPQQQAYAFVPVMVCNMMTSAQSVLGDVCAIPTGTVHRLCNRFEGAGNAAPVTPASHRAWR